GAGRRPSARPPRPARRSGRRWPGARPAATRCPSARPPAAWSRRRCGRPRRPGPVPPPNAWAPRAPRRSSPADLEAAEGRFVPDVLRPGLRVLFCGINPGLWSAAVGHHFARPGNRFWKALHLSGFTPRLLAPDEEDELLALGLGITNLVERATAGAA